MQTLAVATIHDHWAEDAVSSHGLVALKLSARHFAKRHPFAMQVMEWSFCVSIAVFLTAASLIANS